MHNREILRFAMRALEKGLTLVPLKMYFKSGKAKVLLGLCKGKQEFDKRAAMKKAETDRGLRLSLMHRR
jgi:SsrA-binding protein